MRREEREAVRDWNDLEPDLRRLIRLRVKEGTLPDQPWLAKTAENWARVMTRWPWWADAIIGAAPVLIGYMSGVLLIAFLLHQSPIGYMIGSAIGAAIVIPLRSIYRRRLARRILRAAGHQAEGAAAPQGA